MDANEQFAFPSPQPNDTPEVRSAIEQAGILWAEDPKESLKWLRKAAEFASDAGDDLRSVQLARVSADLRNLANISPSLPPTTLPPPSALVQAGIQAAQAAAAAPYAEPLDGTSGTSDVEVTPGEPTVSSDAAADGEFAAATRGDSSGDESLGSDPASGEVGDSAGSDSTGSDSAGSDSAGSDSAGSDSAGSDSAGSDSAGSDSAGSDVTPNVPAVAAQAVASGFGAQALAVGVLSDAGEPPTPPDGSVQPALTPEQIAAFIPKMAFGKDPAQTVPATPAATAAAAALANGPSTYQPFGGFQSAGYAAAASAPKTAPSASAVQPSASQPRWQEPAPTTAPTNTDNGKLAMNTPAATPASKRPAGFGNGPTAWTGGPRPEQPTLVGSPLNGMRSEDAYRADAGSGDPSLASRFVQHRAIAVAVSMTPNSAGHFDLHPLAEGEQVEPGFRMALLVGLSADDRLFPGRG